MNRRLSPAQAHLARKLTLLAAGHGAAAIAMAAAGVAAGELAGGEAPAAPPVRKSRNSPATKHRHAKLGAQATVTAAELQPANDNEPPSVDEAGGEAYALIRMQLAADRRRLKEVQSIERKIALKVEMLPAYADWVRGVLEAGQASGAGAQDEVFMSVMVWTMDVGDFTAALPMIAHALRFGLVLPEHYKRSVPTLVAEETAEAALKAFAADKPFPVGVLSQIQDLTDDEDMPDEVRAKLFKALGFEYLAVAKDTDRAQAVAGWAKSCSAAALASFKRALELNPKVGVKKEVEVLERELKKETAPPT